MAGQKTAARARTRRTEPLEALRAIGLDVASQLELDKLLNKIVIAAVDLLDADDGGGIELYDPETTTLRTLAWVGVGSKMRRDLEPGEGFAGKAFLNGKAMVVEDYREWEDRLPEFAAGPFYRVMTIPLRWRDEKLGVLTVLRSLQKQPFSEDDIWLGELFAAQAAMAISNARLYESERAARQKLDAVVKASRAVTSSLTLGEVLQSILVNCREILPYSTASILILDKGEPAILEIAGFEDKSHLAVGNIAPQLKDSRILKRMIADLKPVIIPDVRDHPDWIRLPSGDHVRGWMSIPLIARRELVGALSLDSDQVGTYTEEHLRIGELLAAQATIAIENAMQFSRAQESVSELEALVEASQALIQAGDSVTMLRIMAWPALQAGTCAAYMLHPDPPEASTPEWVRVAAFLSNPPGDSQLVGRRYRLLDFPAGEIIVANPYEILFIPDLLADHPAVNELVREAAARLGIRALTAIPLVQGKNWLGAVVLTWAEPHTSNAQEEHYFSVIARQMGAILENNRLLEETRQAQRRFEDMALSTSDWLWETDSHARVTYCSERVTQITGYTREEIIGKTAYDFMPPDEARHLTVLVTGASQKKQPLVDVEQWLFHKDGHLLCGLISAVPILSPDGELQGYRGVSRDITREKRAAQRERLAYELGARLTSFLSTDELLKAFVQQMAEGLGYYHATVWGYDQERDEMFLRESAGVDFTTSAAERIKLSAKPSLIALSARSRQPVISNDTRTDSRYRKSQLLPDTRSEVALPLVHGRELLGMLDIQSEEVDVFDEIEVQMLRNLAAQATIAIENARLFEALETQATNLESLVRERTVEVHQERERLKAIVENAGDGIIFSGPDGLIEYVNPAWQRVTGLSAARSIGKNITEVFGEDIVRSINQILIDRKPGQVWVGETHTRRPDGSEYDAALTIAPTPGPAGRVSRLVGVIRDVSAAKQIDRMRSKFVANVSHELRTPITTLKLYHNLLESGPQENREEYVATIGHQLNRLETLVSDLLDVSRLDRGVMEMHMERTDVNSLVGDVLATQRLNAEKRGITLSTTLIPKLPVVNVDRQRMAQVLDNLMANAINYTAEGGTIGVRTWLEQNRDAAWVAVSVWDTGTGISPEDLPYLFDRFFRTEGVKSEGIPGTGLGLAIAKEIVELHRGQIMVESAAGRGSTFTVLLPPGTRRLHK